MQSSHFVTMLLSAYGGFVGVETLMMCVFLLKGGSR